MLFFYVESAGSPEVVAFPPGTASKVEPIFFVFSVSLYGYALHLLTFDRFTDLLSLRELNLS